MARIIISEEHAPHEIKPQEKSVFVCQCGLSKNHPFCDGSHNKAKDEEEGKLYQYDEEGNREEIGHAEGCDCEDDDCDCGHDHEEKSDHECGCGHDCECK